MADVLKYSFTNGHTSMREHGALLINDVVVPAAGRWVLRDKDGNFVDVDKYRNDMFDRYDLTVASTETEGLD